MRRCCGVLSLDEMITSMSDHTSRFQDSSGVAAFDGLVGSLTGRTSDISMATVISMAMDNGFLLYPHRIPVELLVQVPMPYILLHKHHFQTIKKAEDLPEDLGSWVHTINSEAAADFIIDLADARLLVGGRSFFSKIGRELKRTVSSPYAQVAAGLVPGVGPFLAAGMGAYSGAKGGGGLGGALRGGLTGYGLGGVGAGVGGAVGGAFSGVKGASSLAGGNLGFGGGLKAAGMGAFKGAGAGLSQYGAATTAPFSQTMGPIGAGQAAGFQAGQFSAMDATQRAAFAQTPTGVQYGYGAPSAGAPSVPGAPGGGAGGKESFFGKYGSQIGLSAMALSALIPTPEYRGPDIDPETLRAMASRGPMTPAGQAASNEVVRTLNFSGDFANQLAGMAEPFARRGQEMVARDFAEQEKALAARMEAAGIPPNSGIYQESMNKLQSDRRLRDSAIHTDVAVGLGQSFLNYKQAMVGMGVQIDDRSLAEILGMTGMAVEEAAFKYGAKVQDINSVRQSLGQVGLMGLAKGMRLV